MIKIIKENRKTISISVDRIGDVIVKAPKLLSDTAVSSFIKEKGDWIAKKQQKQAKIREFRDSFDFEKYIYILGEKTLPEQYNMFFSKSHTIGDFEKIYRQNAEMLPEMARKKAEELGLRLNNVKLTHSKRFWGSLDRHQNMKLNYKLIILPQEIVEYVIIHELCHGIQLNHSPKFWAEVKKYCPGYKKIKKALELYAFLLDK